jgi:hypothetical protein
MMPPGRGDESAVVDFAYSLFKSLGYLPRYRMARSRNELRLITCGESRRTKLDVCIIDRKANDDVILLVQEDKRFGSAMNPQARLVAKAIAAFQDNNARRRLKGLAPWDSKVGVQQFIYRELPLILHVDHPWYNHGWDISEVLQDSHYPGIG